MNSIEKKTAYKSDFKLKKNIVFGVGPFCLPFTLSGNPKELGQIWLTNIQAGNFLKI